MKKEYYLYCKKCNKIYPIKDFKIESSLDIRIIQLIDAEYISKTDINENGYNIITDYVQNFGDIKEEILEEILHEQHFFKCKKCSTTAAEIEYDGYGITFEDATIVVIPDIKKIYIGTEYEIYLKNNGLYDKVIQKLEEEFKGYEIS